MIEESEVVYHLAAQVAVTTSVTDPAEDFEINARGTFNILEAIRKSHSRPTLLYSSTNKVYGKMDEKDQSAYYCELTLQRQIDAYNDVVTISEQKQVIDFDQMIFPNDDKI